MINKKFLDNKFFEYAINKKLVRGTCENPFNKLYEIKDFINIKNTKYKHDFIIMKFNELLEHNGWHEMGYAYNNIKYSIANEAALRNYIESISEHIKKVVDDYQLLNIKLGMSPNQEIEALNEISTTILTSSQTHQILADIEHTQNVLLIIKNNMDNFKKENDPTNDEIFKLKETYKKVKHVFSKILDLEFINNKLDLAIEYNHTLFKKARISGYIGCNADAFLENKSNENNINYKVIKIEKSKYESMFIFEDDSILFKNKDGGYTEVADNQQFIQIQNEIKINTLKHELRKNPSLLKAMINVIKRTSTNHNQIFTILKNYQNHQAIFKNFNFDIVKSFSTISGGCNYNELEDIDDNMNKLIRQHNAKLLAYSIASKKYHKLYNEETMTLMEMIYDLKLDPEFLQNEIGKKLAAYTDSDQFNETLYKFYTYFTDLTKETILEKSKSTDTKIITDENNVVILQIDNFMQSQLFGSASWCITREDTYYKKYTQHNKKQYFIYNFETKMTDKASLVGITLDGDQLYIAHYKDDTRIKNNDDFVQKCIQLIKKNA